MKSKVPLDEAKITATLPAFLNAVRQSRQNEAFNDWFRREAEKGLARHAPGPAAAAADDEPVGAKAAKKS